MQRALPAIAIRDTTCLCAPVVEYDASKEHAVRRTLFSCARDHTPMSVNKIANLPRLDEWVAQPQIAEADRETKRRQSASPDAMHMDAPDDGGAPPHTPDEGGRRSRAATNRRHSPPTRQEGAATRRDEQEVCIAGRRCAARASVSRVGRGEGGGDAGL